MKKKNNTLKIIITIIVILAILFGIRYCTIKQQTTIPDDVDTPTNNDNNNVPDNNAGYTCNDPDGKDNFAVSSFCEDSYNQLGFSDSCQSNLAIDWYCDSNNICQKTTKQCNYPNEICTNGVCQRMQCSQIINPTSQSNCDIGLCDTGSCNFIPANLFTPARCECLTTPTCHWEGDDFGQCIGTCPTGYSCEVVMQQICDCVEN